VGQAVKLRLFREWWLWSLGQVRRLPSPFRGSGGRPVSNPDVSRRLILPVGWRFLGPPHPHVTEAWKRNGVAHVRRRFFGALPNMKMGRRHYTGGPLQLFDKANFSPERPWPLLPQSLPLSFRYLRPLPCE
jgi:hypothetical protein